MRPADMKMKRKKAALSLMREKDALALTPATIARA
jgi:hypothetical protein